MSLFALPPWDEMQHMHTFMGFAILLAFFTAKLDATHCEEWSIGVGICHLDQSGVEVDLRCKSRYGDKRGTAD